MNKRKDYYVYVHKEMAGRIFYVGKGTGKRAWSNDRHAVWHRYVQDRLNGEHIVEIIEEDLSEEEAERFEYAYIEELGGELVNWINPRRQYDYDALMEYHRRRNANRNFVDSLKELESRNPEAAVDGYKKALDEMYQYESIITERGIVAELSDQLPRAAGDLNILNRLTLCLFKLQRYQEMIDAAEQYFTRLPVAETRKSPVHKRLEKARKKLE